MRNELVIDRTSVSVSVSVSVGLWKPVSSTRPSPRGRRASTSPDTSKAKRSSNCARPHCLLACDVVMRRSSTARVCSWGMRLSTRSASKKRHTRHDAMRDARDQG